ncbi:MAG: hypothetical protein AB7T49_11740 [Oligoflexales bacterium]
MGKNQSVLSVDLGGFKPLPSGSAIKVMCDKAQLDGVTDVHSALSALAHNKYEILVCNAPIKQVFTLAKSSNPAIKIVLVTELPMPEYSGALDNIEETLLDHIVSNRSEEALTIHELRVTIQKMLTGDIFGIEKYLRNQTQVFRFPITGSPDRDPLNKHVAKFVEDLALGQNLSKTAYGISEELLMNAIYDAPMASRKEPYASTSRNSSMILKPEDYAELSFGCDGRILAIGVADPFGLLHPDTFARYLKKVLRRQDSHQLIDNKEGGAGLGFFKILFGSHSLIANVQSRKRTEIISLIDVTEQLRDFSKMARSIHFFSA